MGFFNRPARPSPPPAARYRIADLVTVALGDGQVLVHPWEGTPILLPEHQAELLRRCGGFATLEAHAQRLSAQLGLDRHAGPEILQALQAFGEAGLLITEATDRIEAEPTLGIARVGILTRGRPAFCRRAVERLYAQAVTFERAFELVLADGDPGEAEHQLAALLPGPAPPQVAVRYAGLPEKRAYARRWASEAGVDPALTEYALLGVDGYDFAAGANHNGLLIDGLGEALLTQDDDTCGRLTPAPGSSALGPALRSVHDSTELFLYPDLEAAFAAARFAEADPLAIHEAALGGSVRGVLERAGGVLQVDEASPHLYRSFLGPEARVAATSVGLCGDSGMGSPFYYLLLQGEAQARLFADYPRLRRTRAVLRAPPSLVVSDGAHLMTPHVGLDLRRLLPPFHPVLRNADGVYGAMLRSIAPEAYVAHLPWAVEHRPEARPPLPDSAPLDPGRTAFADLLMLVVQAVQYSPGARSPEARLIQLGNWLREVGQLPDAERAAWLHRRRSQQLARVSARLVSIVDQDQGPPEYLEDVAQALTALQATLPRPELLWPRDLPKDRGPAELGIRLDQFGALLQAWPALVEAARRLRAVDVRVSAPARAGL